MGKLRDKLGAAKTNIETGYPDKAHTLCEEMETDAADANKSLDSIIEQMRERFGADELFDLLEATKNDFI